MANVFAKLHAVELNRANGVISCVLRQLQGAAQGRHAQHAPARGGDFCALALRARMKHNSVIAVFGQAADAIAFAWVRRIELR